MYPVDTINYLLAVGTVVMEIVTIAFLALYLLRNKYPDLNEIGALAHEWGLWLALLATTAGTAFTLFYSEILGFAPCGWCWVQRAFLWPQVLLFALAVWKKDRRIADYSIAFSIFGGIVALYQHYLQMGGESALPCPINPGASDCATRFLFEFGYITFPFMSFSLFAFLIVLMLFVRKSEK